MPPKTSPTGLTGPTGRMTGGPAGSATTEDQLPGHPMHKWIRLAFELLPLQVFAITVRLAGDDPERALLPYGLGALCTALCMAVLLWRRILLDRLLLGVNISIMLGGLGLYARTPGLANMLADLRAAGVFVIILLTAGITYLARPSALLDMPRGNAEPWDRYMLYAIFAAFVLAFITRSQPLISGMLLAALFIVRGSLQQAAHNARQ
ncbi:hypothetical protein [Nitratidesulfovibrio termitidis]|uniref:hypothetical protein n=1 Tax=Nitratidesulfovibrio termitidis TaxID=42252 RepID=UPI001FDFB26C|nr:hypothetical protein [Nitratidesulfovibrio termitidis]